MEQNLSRMRKVSRTATWVVYALMAWAVWMIASTVWQFFRGGVLFGPMGRGTYVLLTLFNMGFYAVVLVVLWLATRLLATARSEAGPFTTANVKRLKGIGLLLVGVALVKMGVAAWMWSRGFWGGGGFDWDLATGEYISNAMGGLIIAIGLAVYCIALVFEYGVALQRQSDETL